MPTQNMRHAAGHWGYTGVRPEDVANASQEFIADVARRLGIDYINDPDLMAWALHNADSSGHEPPERRSMPDDVILAPDGDWATVMTYGIKYMGRLSRSA